MEVKESNFHKPRTHGNAFSEGYKQSVFMVWYRLGKPPASVLSNHIQDDPNRNDRPTINTLITWVAKDFADQAEILDRQVEQEINARLVQEKVQMLEKHAELANAMQTMAMEYLDDHRNDLKVPNAVRLLVEGVRIEQESRGIPQALKKMVNSTDEELLKQLQTYLSSVPANIETLEDDV